MQLSKLRHVDGRMILSVTLFLLGISIFCLSVFAPKVSISQETESEFRNEYYTDYFYISNKERDVVRHEIIYFWWSDTLDGKFHTNDTIYIQYPPSDGPCFKKRVSTSMNVINPPNTSARFDEGWGYRPPVIFPDHAEEIRHYNGIPDLGTNRNGNPAHKDSLTQIVFDEANGVGYFRMRYCGRYITPDNDTVIRCTPDFISESPTYDIPTSGAVFIYGKVWLSASRGTADLMDGPYPNKDSISYHQYISNGFAGKLTLASSDTMVITDNLVFNRARPDYRIPQTLDSCSDILGLISENWIMIGEQAPDTININAALAAIRGAISVEDIYKYGHNNSKHSLFIHGTIAQRNRGIFHTTYQGERGYIQKKWRYDARLTDNPPPHFMKTQGVQ